LRFQPISCIITIHCNTLSPPSSSVAMELKLEIIAQSHVWTDPKIKKL
jgi:hypothetical protein